MTTCTQTHAHTCTDRVDKFARVGGWDPSVKQEKMIMCKARNTQLLNTTKLN